MSNLVQHPSGEIYNLFFKVNDENNRTMTEICSSLPYRHQSDVSDFILESLLLNLGRFQTFFWYFHYWHWTTLAGFHTNFAEFWLLNSPFHYRNFTTSFLKLLNWLSEITNHFLDDHLVSLFVYFCGRLFIE